MKHLPNILYIIGSLAFLAGTLINLIKELIAKS